MTRRQRRLRAGHPHRDAGENTIALINIVFLLLIFFLVAGTLSVPRDASVDLATAEAFGPASLDPAALYIDADGRPVVGGAVLPLADAVSAVRATSGDGPLTVVPDRRMEAARLLSVLGELRSVTDGRVRILVRRPTATETAD